MKSVMPLKIFLKIHMDFFPLTFSWCNDINVAGLKYRTRCYTILYIIKNMQEVILRVVKNKWFNKFAKKEHITDLQLCELIKI